MKISVRWTIIDVRHPLIYKEMGRSLNEIIQYGARPRWFLSDWMMLKAVHITNHTNSICLTGMIFGYLRMAGYGETLVIHATTTHWFAKRFFRIFFFFAVPRGNTYPEMVSRNWMTWTCCINNLISRSAIWLSAR